MLGDVDEGGGAQVGRAHLLMDGERVLEDSLEGRLPLDIFGICRTRKQWARSLLSAFEADMSFGGRGLT